MDTDIRMFLKSLYTDSSNLKFYLADHPAKRTCDMCGKAYFMNGQTIPRIIIRKKILLTDILAKDSYANPDFCEHCTNRILDFMQRFRKLRYSISNPANNNYQLSKDELRLINK